MVSEKFERAMRLIIRYNTIYERVFASNNSRPQNYSQNNQNYEFLKKYNNPNKMSPFGQMGMGNTPVIVNVNGNQPRNESAQREKLNINPADEKFISQQQNPKKKKDLSSLITEILYSGKHK
jgi:hypothetical protein